MTLFLIWFTPFLSSNCPNVATVCSSLLFLKSCSNMFSEIQLCENLNLRIIFEKLFKGYNDFFFFLGSRGTSSAVISWYARIFLHEKLLYWIAEYNILESELEENNWKPRWNVSDSICIFPMSSLFLVPSTWTSQWVPFLVPARWTSQSIFCRKFAK